VPTPPASLSSSRRTFGPRVLFEHGGHLSRFFAESRNDLPIPERMQLLPDYVLAEQHEYGIAAFIFMVHRVRGLMYIGN
jgi:hypothetical protein